jgi:RNA-directed DNA polymerase
MDGNDSASPRTVLRSRRPQCTPRNFMHENRETSEMSAVEADRRPAGEGQGRTARMHVVEESDSGIVPMNHSNKDGKPSAESEEGRPLIEENTHQPRTCPTQSGIRVSPGLAGVRQAAVGFAATIRDRSRMR